MNETFLANVWSKKIKEQLQPSYVWVDGCNREYEGEIKNKGDKVRIKTIATVSAHRISRKDASSALAAADKLDGAELSLDIDQITYAVVKCDNIDELQADVKLWDKSTKKLAEAIACDHDKFMASKMADCQNMISDGNNAYWSLTPNKVLNLILLLKQKLIKNNIPATAPLELIVPPEVATLLIKMKILTDTDNTDVLANGGIGKVLGLVTKQSNTCYTDSSSYTYGCLRVKDDAMAFAQQINKTIAFRDDKNELDADYVKTYSVFGGKILFQDEIVGFKVNVSSGIALENS